MLATLLSRAQFGLEAPEVRIDVHVTPGLPAISVVGLPQAAVKESRDRVRSAILSGQFAFPAGRITVNLSPADLPKGGGRFDLPIAVALLIASDQLPAAALTNCELYGELSLGGEVRPVHGILPAVMAATREGRRLIVPSGNLTEAQLVHDAHTATVSHLTEIAGHLQGIKRLRRLTGRAPLIGGSVYPDLCDVRGQLHARRAIEIAAAGNHSVLLVGTPGTGKSMLAQRLPGILPPLDESEALELATIASVSAKTFQPVDWRHRPFRAPHHSCSLVALVGGGAVPTPGEISLAHHGVLFLDELPEFDRETLESLREPLETGHISIARASYRADFPAQFQLVAAMNPCPCGYLGEPNAQCRCTLAQIRRYQSRISGPLLDRIDLHARVKAIEPAQLRRSDEKPESTESVAARVKAARDIQRQRQQICNGNLDPAGVDRICVPASDARDILDRAVQRFRLSARAYHRVLKVARTIADLEGTEQITAAHISEALLFRQMDLSPGPSPKGEGKERRI
jgi:magnesium chelatase family protein